MTKLVLITGVDGCGKSTILSHIKKNFSPKVIRTVNAPQFFTDETLPFFEETKMLERVSKFADEIHNPILKANVTILAMSYQGEIVDHIIKQDSPEIVICERHALVDSVAYEKFYLPFLQKAPAEIKTTGVLLAHEEPLMNKVIQRFRKKIKLHDLTLQNMHKLIAIYCEPDDITKKVELKRIFDVSTPDKMILLTVPKQVMESRIDSAQKELHESINVLSMMQDSLIDECEQYFTSDQFVTISNDGDISKFILKVMTELGPKFSR